MNRRSLLTVSILSLCLLLPATIRAQPQPPAGQGAQKFEQLAKQLNLTPDQKMQLIPILVSEAPKLQAIRSDTTLTKVQKMTRIRALHQQTEPQVKAIRTPDQFQQLRDFRMKEMAQAVQQRADRQSR